MTNVTIRLARSDELKIVQDLNYALFVSDNRHFGDLNLQWPYKEKGEAYFKKMIAGDDGICLLAEINGDIVGYLAGSYTNVRSAYYGSKAELDNMFVVESYRSQGTGDDLVQKFLIWCKQKKVVSVYVNAFSPNTQAIKFYEREGFKSYSTTLRLQELG